MLPDDLERQVRLDRALALQVDRVCNRFENALRGGQQPRIEEYLGQVPEQGRDFLLHELMVAELEHGVAGATEESYRERFPSKAGLVVEARAAAGGSGALSGPEPVGAIRDLKAGQSPDNPAAPSVSLAIAITPIDSVPAFIATLRSIPLLQEGQLTDLMRENSQGAFTTPHELGKRLLDAGWLTAYQVNLLLQGRGGELQLGAYLLQERLGEGGTGQVFKARHRALNRLVAVKVIRPELVNDPEALRRFYREMQIVGQLDHPHIVHAYDAGPAGSHHILVMEYLPGTDLGRLVKEKGPLPVAEASEYIRQAALGLHHAHEQGLVHRDIKPSNLLVVSGQWSVDSKDNPNSSLVTDHCPLTTIKILDLGLARLETATDSQATCRITPQGPSLIGTPDYLAPEQAMNFHGADARADVYGLGCTLFHLLIGRPPFGGGTLTEKLLRHQQSPPPVLAQVRPDVPAGLEAVLGKMLAKDPGQRYQTAAALAEALAPWASGQPAIHALPGQPSVVSGAEQAVALSSRDGPDATGELSPPLAVPVRASHGDGPVRRMELPVAAVPARSAPKLGLALGVGGGVLLLCGILLGFLLGQSGSSPPALTPLASSRTIKGPSKVAVPSPPVFLCDLQEQDVRVPVGGWRFGKKGDLGHVGERIIVEGKPSPHGLGMHPPAGGESHVAYQLNKQFQRFSGTAALNDSVSPYMVQSAVIFQVMGDQKMLWQSKEVTKQHLTEEFSISVSGVMLLELKVFCPAGNFAAHAVWVEPQLTK